MGVGERCARHPGALAGWRCRSCGAALCPGCTWVHRAGTAELPACARCRGYADPITVHRAALRPFHARILEALWWPLGVSGLISLAALGAVLFGLKWFGLLGRVLAVGVWWGFVFHVIRRSSIGDDDLGPPDYSDFFSDLVAPAIRGVVATAVLWVPAVAWGVTILLAGASLAEAARDPLLWILLAAGVAYGPAAIAVAACAGSFLSLLNPLVGVRVIVRLGRDYWLAAAAVGALLATNAGVALAAHLVASIRFPLVPGWIAETMTCWLPVVAARVLGVLLHVRGDDVGLGDEASYLVPVLGDTPPRGAEPVLEAQVAEPEAPVAPIDLDAPAARAAPAAAAPAPSPAPPPAPADPAAAIAGALAANDPARAAALFAAYRGPDASLPARTLFELAKAAADAGQHGLSARALHAAGTGADAAVAPNALLVLARVYERRLARPAEAQQVLSYLVARWPDSDAARHARAALPPAGVA